MPLYMNEQDFENYMNSMCYHHDLIATKNKDHVYISANENVAKFTGFKTIDAMIGQTDFDLKCEAAKSAIKFQAQDNYCLENKIDIEFLAFDQYSMGKWEILHGNHFVICDEHHESFAITTTARTISHTSLFKLGIAFNRMLVENVNAHQSFFIRLTKQYPKINLTQRQSQTLFYLIHGYTAKETAKAMHISDKTVERHLEDIKIKLDCHSKSQLIEKAIHEELLDVFIGI